MLALDHPVDINIRSERDREKRGPIYNGDQGCPQQSWSRSRRFVPQGVSDPCCADVLSSVWDHAIAKTAKWSK